MKYLIVDDEPLAQQRLIQLLTKINPKIDLFTAKNGKIALEVLNQESDITTVFLDIRMPVLDGLDTAKIINTLKHPPVIIFTTAYNEFALDAFDLNAIAYLLKPIALDKLKVAIQKSCSLNAMQLAVLNNHNARSHLSSKIGKKIQLINVQKIRYFYSEDKYIFAVQKNSKHIVEESIKNLEEEFSQQFIRVHRNALVNISQISGLVKRNTQNYVTLLEDDTEIEISRRALPLVKATLNL